MPFIRGTFSNRYGIMGIIFTIFDISRNYRCPFQGFFIIYGIMAQIFIQLWNYGPKIHQNLRNYEYQFFGQNGTSPSHNRLSYSPEQQIHDTCLSYLSDKIMQAFEKGMFTGMILIDLQKAFDTVDHDIFLEKMKHLAFSDSTIFWFRSYLTSRTFFVNIEKEISSPGELSCGVPQGSILGPLICLLYVNDMPQAVDCCDLLLYADDSCLVFRDNNINEIEKQLNKNLNSFCDWFVDNKLSIHFAEDKAKPLLFGRKNKRSGSKKLDIRRGDIKIKQYTSVTYVGCVLDESLSG